MKLHRPLLLSLACLLFACGGDDSNLFPGADGGGGDGSAGGDATADGNAPLDGQPPPDDGGADGARDGGHEAGPVTGVSYVRFAQLAPGAVALDVCFSAVGKPQDFGSSTPRYAATAPAGIGFLDVTSYGAIDSGAYGVRFVAPTTDCTRPANGFPDATLTISNGVYATLFARGDADKGATLLADDPPATALVDGGMDGAAVRLVHALPGTGAVDVGKGSLAGGDYADMFVKVPYLGTAAPGGGVDARGYAFPVIIQGDTMSVHVDGDANDLATWSGVSVDVGEVATMFLVAGGALPDGGTATARALLCTDDYAQPSGGATNPTCALLTP